MIREPSDHAWSEPISDITSSLDLFMKIQGVLHKQANGIQNATFEHFSRHMIT